MNLGKFVTHAFPSPTRTFQAVRPKWFRYFYFNVLLVFTRFWILGDRKLGLVIRQHALSSQLWSLYTININQRGPRIQTTRETGEKTESSTAVFSNTSIWRRSRLGDWRVQRLFSQLSGEQWLIWNTVLIWDVLPWISNLSNHKVHEIVLLESNYFEACWMASNLKEENWLCCLEETYTISFSTFSLNYVRLIRICVRDTWK